MSRASRHWKCSPFQAILGRQCYTSRPRTKINSFQWSLHFEHGENSNNFYAKFQVKIVIVQDLKSKFPEVMKVCTAKDLKLLRTIAWSWTERVSREKTLSLLKIRLICNNSIYVRPGGRECERMLTPGIVDRRAPIVSRPLRMTLNDR